jgi:hypothetical protein
VIHIKLIELVVVQFEITNILMNFNFLNLQWAIFFGWSIIKNIIKSVLPPQVEITFFTIVFFFYVAT